MPKHLTESALVDQRTGAQEPKNQQVLHFELGVWTMMWPVTKHHFPN